MKDVAFTPDGRFLVSASDDKTIRIWDRENGKTLRTLRGAVGPDQEGKVFAVAVSPDGKTVAAGGWFGPGHGETPPYGDLRLFDFATGRITAVLNGADYPVYALAFSPDGQWLASGGQYDVVLWRRDGKSATGWTKAGTLDPESDHVTRLAFLAGGTRLAAATEDNGIRLWDLADGSLLDMPEAETWRDAATPALGPSADGTRFATGNREGRVSVWNAADGSLAGELPRQGFAVGSVLMAGDRIVVSCGYFCGDKNRTLVWRLGDRKPLLDDRGHDNTVNAGAVAPDGFTVATAGGTRHAIRLWDARTGEERAVLQGVGSPVMAVGLDQTGQAVAWGTQNPCPAEFACPATMGELETALLLPTPERYFEEPAPVAAQTSFIRAVTAANGWSLKAEAMGADGPANAVLVVSKDGKPLQRIENDATTGFLHAAFTLIGTGSRLVTGGSDGTLTELASDSGRLLGNFSGGHTGEIHAMAASEKLNLLVTGSADQTIRLWNLQTRELIVSMFFAGPEWVIWMPQGYYFSSDEGDKLIGWQVNQGSDREARFIRAGQLKTYLNSPEMVRRAITLRSAAAAVRELRPGVDRELEKLLRRKAPEFELRVADSQEGVRDGFVAVEVTGADAAELSAESFSVLSNSRNAGSAVMRSVAGESDRLVIEVPVEAGENSISVTATSAFGYLTERSVKALVRKARTEEEKGKLFVVAIGVDEYPFLETACGGRSCNLRYPVDDAAGFLQTVMQKSAPMFSGVETLVLLNREALEAEPSQARAVGRVLDLGEVGEPDSDTIADELADFLDRPGPDDTTFVFVAGHGVNIDEDYYFVPTDGRRSGEDRWKRSSLVDWADIQKAVERAKGRRLMLLDTCHAANAFNPRLAKDAADARIVVFSATAANNTAAELPELGHGVFTYSLLEGWRGKAGAGDGVRLLGLADFVDREVERLTAKRQKPFYYVSNVENFLLAGP